MDRRSFLQRAAATPAMRYALAADVKRAEVRGHVVIGKRPLKDVRVSDRFTVVRTDGSGEFRLPVGPQSGPFLFVTVPKGYWIDRFYVPTSKAAAEGPTFRLRKNNQSGDYRALYITDIHLGDNRADQSLERFKATIDEINRMDPLPAFCWMGGDISLQRGKGRQYVGLMSELKVSVRNAVGNHEMLIKQQNPRGEFQELFGPTYYSFDVGDVHYVTLDGCDVHVAQGGYKNVEGRLSPRELHWLAEDLKQTPDGMTTVVAVHIPLVSDYPQRRGTTAKKAPYWVIQNADEVIDLLVKRNTPLVLQGHLHENQRMMHKKIEFVESNSICGQWWTAPGGTRENGVSGEPRGYRELTVSGGKIIHRYLSSAESRVSEPAKIVGRPETLPKGKDAKLEINVFDGTEKTRVLASFDRGAFQKLQPSASHLHYQNLKPAHHWRLNLQAGDLTPGKHAVRIRIEEPGTPAETVEHVFRV